MKQTIIGDGEKISREAGASGDNPIVYNEMSVYGYIKRAPMLNPNYDAGHILSGTAWEIEGDSGLKFTNAHKCSKLLQNSFSKERSVESDLIFGLNCLSYG